MSGAAVETRAAKATVAAALSMGLSVVLQLVSVPVCLRFWGEETYGLWLALLALATLVRTLDFGFTAYVGNELNLLYHRDPLELRRTLSSALWGGAALGVIELLAAALIVWSGALASLLGVPEEVAQHGRAGLAFVILMLGFVSMGPYLGVVHKLMVPAGMLHQATWWFMGVQITQSLSLVAAAALGLSLSEAAVLFGVCLALLQAASAIYVARKLPRFFPWWSQPSRSRALRDVIRSTAMTGASLLTQAGTNGIVMVVSSGLGAAAVPAFTTVRTLTTLWATLTNVLTAPLLPDVVRYHAQGEAKKLVALIEAQWLIANGMVNLSILVSLPFLDLLYRTWTRGVVALDPGLLDLMLLSIVVGTPGMPMLVYLSGINHLRALTALHAVRGLVPLAVGFALVPSLGLVAVGLGIALGEILGPVVVGALFLRALLGTMGGAGAPRWQPTALGTALTSGFLLLHWLHGPHFGAAYAVAVAGVLGSVVWGWQVTSAEVRGRLVGLLRRQIA